MRGPALGLSCRGASRNAGTLGASRGAEKSGVANFPGARRDRVTMKKTTAQMTAKPTIPPMAPPAMTPTFGEDFCREGSMVLAPASECSSALLKLLYLIV